MTNLFLKVEYLDEIQNIIRHIYPKSEVWAYGSRVEGNAQTAHEGSDLDLCVKDFGEEHGDVMSLREAFNESNLPFLIDVFEYQRLPQTFQQEINKKYVVIYSAKKDTR